MAQGGYRPGAGRPKGSKNKRQHLLKEGVRVAAQYGVAPLDYLLSVMCDTDQPIEVRMFAAKAALPYCTPRMAAVPAAEDNGALTHEEWVRLLAKQCSDLP